MLFSFVAIGALSFEPFEPPKVGHPVKVRAHVEITSTDGKWYRVQVAKPTGGTHGIVVAAESVEPDVQWPNVGGRAPPATVPASLPSLPAATVATQVCADGSCGVSASHAGHSHHSDHRGVFKGRVKQRERGFFRGGGLFKGQWFGRRCRGCG